jgi:hypothetical protein
MVDTRRDALFSGRRAAQTKRGMFAVGNLVEACWRPTYSWNRSWFPGVVARVYVYTTGLHQGEVYYDVAFADNDTCDGISAKYVRPRRG